jgi:hypothetical protein
MPSGTLKFFQDNSDSFLDYITLNADAEKLKQSRHIITYTNMKAKILISITIIILSKSAFSQNWYPLNGNLYTDPSSAKVGIGTSNPSAALDINGNVLISQVGFYGFRRSSDGAAIPMISVTANGTLSNLQIGSGSGQFSTGYTDIFAGGSSKIRILGNGNIGIGILIPDALLTINGVANHTATSMHVIGDTKLESGYLDFTRPSFTIAKARIFLSSYTGPAGLRFMMSDDGSFSASHSFDALYIGPTGKLGIGTTNPTAALTVNGRILAEGLDIILDVPYSDFVFEENYSMPTLGQLDQFIKTNKHLPDVPSAKDFKEKGYNVGQMDDILLRKVEELTLYVIQLKKENEKLQAEIDKINK